MKVKDYLKEISAKDLSKLNEELIKEIKHLQELNTNLALGKVKNFREIRDARKNIARLKTVISNKALELLSLSDEEASKESDHGKK